MEIETLFVIFAPGLGGNHLANLLSLTPRFYRNVDLELYNSMEVNAHFATIRNLRLTSITSHIDALTGINTVLCGHLGEYIWLKQSGLTVKFKNKKFLIITMPQKNTLAYYRLVKFNNYNCEYYYKEQCILYTQEILKKIFKEHNFISIPAEIIFSDSIDNLITVIQEKLNTTINVVQANKIHQIWITKIKQNIQLTD